MTDNLQQSFRALADPSRREILMHLSKQDMTIKEVSEHFDMTRAAVKKHLTILQQGNLISIQKSGRERINSLKPMACKRVASAPPVTWQLEEAYGGTFLSLTHEGVGDMEESPLGILMALDDGWDEHIAKLRTQLKNEEQAIPSCSD
ncbi:Transcriptional repressor SdpR [Nymphon striatum]|nr:Transcriptional repressor SdpR [Nymphon striatum]